MGKELIFGENVLIEAIKNKVVLEEVLIEDTKTKTYEHIILSLRKEYPTLDVKYVNKKEIDKLCQRNHQGILGYMESFKYKDIDEALEECAHKKNAFFLILDHLEDPQNLGAIIRTAHCGNVEGIIIPENRSSQVNSTVIKVSCGAVFQLPIIRVTNINTTMAKMKEKGFWIFGADMDGKNNIFDMDHQGKSAIVIGNEGKGISQSVLKNCDDTFYIPQKKNFSSLNASVAAGIIIYDVYRKIGD